MRLVGHAFCVVLVVGCDFPRPVDVVGMDATPGGVDASVDTTDASLVGMDAIDAASVDGSPKPLCTPNQAIRCDGDTLVRCNSDGSAEVRDDCQLGCDATDVRCKDVAPQMALPNIWT